MEGLQELAPSALRSAFAVETAFMGEIFSNSSMEEECRMGHPKIHMQKAGKGAATVEKICDRHSPALGGRTGAPFRFLQRIETFFPDDALIK